MESHKVTLYSPLTPFFADQSHPTSKKGEKVMFGQNGWLERTGETPEKKRDVQKRSIFEIVKKIAKEMLNNGRLDVAKLKKISDAWTQKGRPKVVGFRFDLETQIELIRLHIHEFRFYGQRQNSQAEISGLLHTMKVNARAMGVRTYCQPDVVIAKQLVEAQSFFDLLGVPEVQHIALQHVAQFFKVIVEREQHKANRPGNDESLAVPDIVNAQWEGPSKEISKSRR
ncbi:hypothetical protein SAPIO_CDS3896 [Scedosporium apiospermum]|uniref:Uncharacterized protein n=1 Tax=Pseudallescheria apiosperma TaxID=563466 RepID=A0A084G8U3_PSEDA|nr:uncharacterized protein SAPIO_CDS3896 [Scedosporium apiospermum]KEZ43755.1 hypothetical protein SAPIO_CDS3896 [Scedosporium apiospermum]